MPGYDVRERVDARASTAFGTGTERAVAGMPTSFHISLVNRMNAPADVPITALQVQLYRGRVKVEDGVLEHVAEDGVGRFRALYQLRKIGSYQLHVLVNEQHVRGSPFSVTCVAGRPDGAHCLLQPEPGPERVPAVAAGPGVSPSQYSVGPVPGTPLSASASPLAMASASSSASASASATSLLAVQVHHPFRFSVQAFDSHDNIIRCGGAVVRATLQGDGEVQNVRVDDRGTGLYCGECRPVTLDGTPLPALSLQVYPGPPHPAHGTLRLDCPRACPGAELRLRLWTRDADGQPTSCTALAVLSGAMERTLPLRYNPETQQHQAAVVLPDVLGALHVQALSHGRPVAAPQTLFVAPPRVLTAAPLRPGTRSLRLTALVGTRDARAPLPEAQTARSLSGPSLVQQLSEGGGGAVTQRSRPLSAFSRATLRSVVSTAGSMDVRLLTSRT